MKRSCYEKMVELATAEYKKYDFGPYIIEGSEGYGWEPVEDVDSKDLELRRILLVSHKELEEEADDIRVLFSVRFKSGKICDVRAVEIESKLEIGNRG
jgi:hypothetical protein